MDGSTEPLDGHWVGSFLPNVVIIHLIARNEIFVYGQTTTLSFGGASVAQVIKMMEFQSEDHLDTLVIRLGTNEGWDP